MNVALVDDIASYLKSSGLAPTGWRVCTYLLPPDPDRVICLTEYAGNPPFTKVGLDEPGIQIRARGAAEDPETPRELLETIRLGLDGLGPIMLGTTNVRWVKAVQSAPAPLGMDSQKRRWEFVCNFIVGKGR